AVGEVAPIKDGPLGGIEAVFERELPGYKRAILLLKALSCQAKIVVDLGNQYSKYATSWNGPSGLR
ncbi:MAG: hypothetical protein KGJ48_10955, partial [Nitrospirota bacterium]|nr:hypothetical protein [Nitrospirota bacterium]